MGDVDRGKTIEVLGLEASEDRASFFGRDSARYAREPVSVDALASRLRSFSESMKEVVQGVPETMGGFKVDEITLSIEITAKGTVSLLGSGGEIGGTGGITITLRRG